MEQQQEQQERQHRVVGRPFLPGQSGNPKGARSRKQRHADLIAELSADMGGLDVLTSGDRVLLGRAVDLLLLRPNTQDDRVRLLNSATRIIEGVRRRYRARREPDRGSRLDQYLASKGTTA